MLIDIALHLRLLGLCGYQLVIRKRIVSMEFGFSVAGVALDDFLDAWFGSLLLGCGGDVSGAGAKGLLVVADLRAVVAKGDFDLGAVEVSVF